MAQKMFFKKSSTKSKNLENLKNLSREKLQEVNPEDLNLVLQKEKVKWRIDVKKYDPKLLNEHLNAKVQEDKMLSSLPSWGFKRTKYNYYCMDKNGKLAKKESTSLPTRFDWREMGNVLTSIKNQGSCGACVAFATSAAIEAQYRIQNYNNSQNTIDLSEASLFFTAGYNCKVGATFTGCMEAAKKEGVCLEYNYPYMAIDQTASMSEGSNRIVKIEDYRLTYDVRLMKRWIIENGPLVAGFDLYSDFKVFWYSCTKETDVYTCTILGEKEDEQHAVCVVGYDDSIKAWICKNSWGSCSAHPSGYFYMGYDECNINNCMILPVNVYDKITYDVISYNPANLKIVKETNDWLLTDGQSRMKIFATEEDALNGLRIAKRHTRQCFVGRSNKRSNRKDFILSYWDGNSGLQSEPLTKNDKISYNPQNVSAQYNAERRYWEIIEKEKNSSWGIFHKSKIKQTLFIADNMADALAMLAIVEKHSKSCYIGRNNNRSNRKDFIMHYFE